MVLRKWHGALRAYIPSRGYFAPSIRAVRFLWGTVPRVHPIIMTEGHLTFSPPLSVYALDACHGDVAVQFRRLEVSRAITPLYGPHAKVNTEFSGVLLKVSFRWVVACKSWDYLYTITRMLRYFEYNIKHSRREME